MSGINSFRASFKKSISSSALTLFKNAFDFLFAAFATTLDAFSASDNNMLASMAFLV